MGLDGTSDVILTTPYGSTTAAPDRLTLRHLFAGYTTDPLEELDQVGWRWYDPTESLLAAAEDNIAQGRFTTSTTSGPTNATEVALGMPERAPAQVMGTLRLEQRLAQAAASILILDHPTQNTICAR